MVFAGLYDIEEFGLYNNFLLIRCEVVAPVFLESYVAFCDGCGKNEQLDIFVRVIIYTV